MVVNIVFFGATAQSAGGRSLCLEISEESRSSDVVEQLIIRFPHLAKHELRHALNQEHTSGNEIVRDGDEIAVFTAVSGG